MKSIQIIKNPITLLALSTTSLFGAGHLNPTIVETADQAGIFTTLLAAAEAADLVGVIDNAVPKTVFAPTDAAFEALPEGTVATLLEPENKELLTDIIKYHIVMGETFAADLRNGAIPTSNGSGLTTNIDNGVVINGSANVVTADIEAKNGLIHIIDAVLLPPEANLVDLAVSDPELSTLVAAVTAAGLGETLQNLGPFTVLAPTNAAFEALPEGTLDTLLMEENISTLQNILLYHIVSGPIYSNNLFNGPVGMFNGGTLNINLNGPVFETADGGANPVATDLIANNGVVHKIDQVLLPASGTVVEALIADGRFTTLVAAAQAAELVDALNGLAGGTIFAPTDEAFGKLPAGTVETLLLPENQQTLIDALAYHVVPQNLYATTLQNRTYTTLGGSELTVKVMDSGVMVGEVAMVESANIISGNGVVHAVDSFIPMPATIATKLDGMSEYSTLVAALKAAELFDTLNTEGPFTLFAPDNDAFAKIAPETLQELLLPENKETLASILLAHVLGNQYFAGELLTMPVETLQGKVLNVHFDHEILEIGDEAVIQSIDMPAGNGFIHGIDTVIIP